MDSQMADRSSSEGTSHEHRALAGFLTEASEAEIQASLSFHQAKIEKSQLPGEHLSIPEILERIRLAEKAQEILDDEKGKNPNAKYPPLELSLIHFSYFIYADKDALKSLVEVHPVGPAPFLESRMRNIENFLCLMLQKLNGPIDSDALGNLPASENNSSGSEYQPTVNDVDGIRTINRNVKEADEARSRDANCIATNCAEFQVCHILPFTVNNTASKLKTARKIFISVIAPLMSEKDWHATEALVVPRSREIGTSDRRWNLVALNHLAHALWNKGYFALEWIGVEGVEPETGEYLKVKLRWHWLTNRIPEALEQAYLGEKGPTKGHAGRAVKFGTDHQGMAVAIKKCLDSTRTASASANGVSLCRMANHRPLITGDVLNIRVKLEDVEKTRLMIEIQWLALKMAAFCAAAEVVDELDPEPLHLEELSTYWDFEMS